MNYLLIDPPVHIYSSACLQGKNMGRFSHWSEQKTTQCSCNTGAAVLFFGTTTSSQFYSNRGDLIQTSNKQKQRLDPWKKFLSFHFIFNVRASMNLSVRRGVRNLHLAYLAVQNSSLCCWML